MKGLLIGGVMIVAVLLLGYMILRRNEPRELPQFTINTTPVIEPTSTLIPEKVESTASVVAPLEISGRETMDKLFAKVAVRNPGFGGMYVDDEKDILYIYLRSGDVRAVFTDVKTAFGGDSLPKNVQALPATYSFLELKEWHDRIAGYAFQIPGVNMMDIDDMENRLTIGVETPEARATVEKKVAELGIPPKAVTIIHSGAITPL